MQPTTTMFLAALVVLDQRGEEMEPQPTATGGGVGALLEDDGDDNLLTETANQVELPA